jgi:hypothetical protein
MTSPSVFGVVHLGSIVIETERFTDWRRFGTDAIGMHRDDLDTGVMRSRLDEQECRFLLRRGPARRRDEREGRTTGHGAAVAFPRSQGHRTGDLHDTGPVGRAAEHARLGLRHRWLGMGHIALTSARPALVRGYFGTVFDALLTDCIDETISGVKLKIRFLRVNERHHSIAVAAVLWRPSTHQGISIWGLTTVGQTIIDKLNQFRLAARSVIRPETTVPSLSRCSPTPMMSPTSPFRWGSGVRQWAGGR